MSGASPTTPKQNHNVATRIPVEVGKGRRCWAAISGTNDEKQGHLEFCKKLIRVHPWLKSF
jgi:hypothetical protein